MNATATSPLSADTTNLRRDTYKGHGQPQSFYYWGTGKSADEQDGTLITSTKVTGTTVTLIDGRGTEVRTVDVRTRFWISEAGQDDHTEDEAESTEDAQAIQRAAAPAKAARPSRNAKLSPCLCKCGAQVKGMYKQGHDARHASQVAQAAIKALLTDTDLNLADSGLFDELPTEALRVKAANIVAKTIK